MPDDVLIRCLGFGDLALLLRASLVCRRWTARMRHLGTLTPAAAHAPVRVSRRLLWLVSLGVLWPVFGRLPLRTRRCTRPVCGPPVPDLASPAFREACGALIRTAPPRFGWCSQAPHPDAPLPQHAARVGPCVVFMAAQELAAGQMVLHSPLLALGRAACGGWVPVDDGGWGGGRWRGCLPHQAAYVLRTASPTCAVLFGLTHPSGVTRERTPALARAHGATAQPVLVLRWGPGGHLETRRVPTATGRCPQLLPPSDAPTAGA